MSFKNFYRYKVGHMSQEDRKRLKKSIEYLCSWKQSWKRRCRTDAEE